MNITKTTDSITIELNDTEQKVLLNDLMDWQQWIETAVTEKIYNCKSRLIENGTRDLIRKKSVESIPTDEGQLLDLIFSQPDYKARATRELDKRGPA